MSISKSRRAERRAGGWQVYDLSLQNDDIPTDALSGQGFSSIRSFAQRLQRNPYWAKNNGVGELPSYVKKYGPNPDDWMHLLPPDLLLRFEFAMKRFNVRRK